MRQLDLRQAPAEVEYAFQLVYDAGNRAPDGIEHIGDRALDPVYDVGDGALYRVEAVTDPGLHSVYYIHDRRFDAVPDGTRQYLF